VNGTEPIGLSRLPFPLYTYDYETSDE